LGGDCFPSGIRRPVSTLLRKVGFADRIYLCGALINFRRGKIYAWRRERHRRRRLAEGKCFDRGFKAFMPMELSFYSSV